jgi:hypothetical protein
VVPRATRARGVVRLLLDRKDVNLNAKDGQVDGRIPLIIAP